MGGASDFLGDFSNYPICNDFCYYCRRYKHTEGREYYREYWCKAGVSIIIGDPCIVYLDKFKGEMKKAIRKEK